MEENHVNREHKDRLFKYIFGNADHKEFTLELYNAINGTSYTDTDMLQIENLENVVYMSMVNDLSFLIADSMNLYEQQSTYNPNMPIRMLCYAGRLYSQYFERNNLKNRLYSSNILKIPCPNLIVFYNGERKKKEETILKLSDAFDNKEAKSDIEVNVRMININYGSSSKILDKCRPLSDYSLFVSYVRQSVKAGLSITESVDRAVKALDEDSNVRKLIEVNKAGVADMFLTEYDEQGVMDVIREDGIAEGRAEGRAEGEYTKAVSIAKAMLEDGIPLEKVSQYSSISVEELKKL